MLYMIDNEIFDDFEKVEPWGWKSSMQLHEELTDECCRFRAVGKEAVQLSRRVRVSAQQTSEKLPQRFQKKHTNTGNVWFIHPPA